MTRPNAPESPKLSRNVVVLSWVSFFQDIAAEMLYPILPLFLTGDLGASAAVVGLIEGLAEGLSSVLKGLSGRLADRMARRPLVAAGYGLSSTAKALIALATGWPFVLFCRVLDRVGKGLRTSPRDALIVADTPPELRGRAFGFHRAFDTAGAVVGPLVGVGLYHLLHHKIRPIFLIAAVPAFISTTVILLVREGAHHRDPGPTAVNGMHDLPHHYWRALVLVSLFGLANFSDALIILRLKQLGLGLVAILLAYAAYNATYAMLSYPAGVLADHRPKHLVFAAGIAIFAVAYLGFGLVSQGFWTWLLIVVYGGYAALTEGVGKAWIASLVPKPRVGTALGYYQAAIGGASVVAGIWAGLLWGSGGRVPFLISASMACAVALTIYLSE